MMKAFEILIVYILCEFTWFITMGNTTAIVLLYFAGISFLGLVYYKIINFIIRRIKDVKTKK